MNINDPTPQNDNDDDDAVMIIMMTSLFSVQFAKWFTFTWTFGLTLCKGVHYVQNLSVICSVLTLTVMSLER